MELNHCLQMRLLFLLSARSDSLKWRCQRLIILLPDGYVVIRVICFHQPRMPQKLPRCEFALTDQAALRHGSQNKP